MPSRWYCYSGAAATSREFATRLDVLNEFAAVFRMSGLTARQDDGVVGPGRRANFEEIQSVALRKRKATQLWSCPDSRFHARRNGTIRLQK